MPPPTPPRRPGPSRRLLLVAGALAILLAVAIYVAYAFMPADPADAEVEAGFDVNTYEGDVPQRP